MVFNLIGPPAVGKTYIAERLSRRIHGLIYIPIDRVRREAMWDEEATWVNVKYACLLNDVVLLESTGTSWQLWDTLKSIPNVWGIPKIFSLELTGDKEFLYKRLASRHRLLGVTDEQYIRDEFMTIDIALESLSKYPVSRSIHLHSEEDLEVAEEVLANFIISRINDKRGTND